MSDSSNLKRIPKLMSLEGLRGQMALWVFLTHYITLAGFDFSKSHGAGFLIANGTHAVNVFILLSGFVIALLCDKKQEKYMPFITRRAFRLFPAYLIALLVSVLTVNIAIEALQSSPFPVSKTEGRLAIFEDSLENKTTHLLLHIPLLHGIVPEKILPNTSYAFMGQAWSLTLEWQFYLLAPFLALFLYGRAVRSTFITVGIFAAAFLLHRTSQQSYILNSLHLFIGGMASYSLYNFGASNKANTNKAAALLLLLCIAIASVDFRDTSIAACIWILALYGELKFSKISSITNSFLSNRFCKFIGESSYSFYCLHMAVLYICSYLLIKYIDPNNRFEYASLLLITSLPISIGVSALSYKFVELPFIKLGKRAASRL